MIASLHLNIRNPITNNELFFLLYDFPALNGLMIGIQASETWE